MVLTKSTAELQHGATAPAFSLPGTDGKTYGLDSFPDAEAFLIIFLCNHCPYVIPKFPEIERITADYREKGLVVLCINPNEDEGYPEDSFEKMQELMEREGYTFHYLRDENQEVAKAYGAVCTPDPFLFDKERKLIFHGRIDDTHADKPASVHELHTAIGEYLSTGKIDLPEQPSMGCSIKWKY